jgi:hypothetical protein
VLSEVGDGLLPKPRATSCDKNDFAIKRRDILDGVKGSSIAAANISETEDPIN